MKYEINEYTREVLITWGDEQVLGSSFKVNRSGSEYKVQFVQSGLSMKPFIQLNETESIDASLKLTTDPINDDLDMLNLEAIWEGGNIEPVIETVFCDPYIERVKTVVYLFLGKPKVQTSSKVKDCQDE